MISVNQYSIVFWAKKESVKGGALNEEQENIRKMIGLLEKLSYFDYI